MGGAQALGVESERIRGRNLECRHHLRGCCARQCLTFIFFIESLAFNNRVISPALCLAFIPQTVSISLPIVSLFTKERQGLAKVAWPCQQMAQDYDCCMASTGMALPGALQTLEVRRTC